jgi:hypothetical protein
LDVTSGELEGVQTRGAKLEGPRTSPDEEKELRGDRKQARTGALYV